MHKRNQTSVLLGLTVAVIVAAMLELSAGAQSLPPLINYQGRLTDQTGAPLAVGPYSIQFRLWDSATAANAGSGGDLIWGQQYANIAVQSNGVFNVILGAAGGSALPSGTPNVNNLAYAFNGSNCFLGVTVVSSNGTPIPSPLEILPRQQLMSVPFAFTANTAVNASTASFASSVANGIIGLTNLAPRLVVTNSTPQSPTPVGGIAISPSSGAFNTTVSNTAPNLTVTITTSGRPVFVGLMSDGQSSTSYSIIGASGNPISGWYAASFQIQRGTNIVGIYAVGGVNEPAVPSSALHTMDLPPGPGTYTYTVTVVPLVGTGSVNYSKLYAFEL
ncbi:MAG: hypothetical protein ABSG59_12360 [Verrucomicrobiota bacterium]|jgi:hypothetical protein